MIFRRCSVLETIGGRTKEDFIGKKKKMIKSHGNTVSFKVLIRSIFPSSKRCFRRQNKTYLNTIVKLT